MLLLTCLIRVSFLFINSVSHERKNGHVRFPVLSSVSEPCHLFAQEDEKSVMLDMDSLSDEAATTYEGCVSLCMKLKLLIRVRCGSQSHCSRPPDFCLRDLPRCAPAAVKALRALRPVTARSADTNIAHALCLSHSAACCASTTTARS
jgi:hypothetical protein